MAGMLMGACSKDEDLARGDNSHASKKEAYLGLTLHLPQTGMSRAGTPQPGEDGDGSQAGSAEENQVNKLLVFGFNSADRSFAFKEEIDGGLLSKINNSDASYSTTTPFRVAAGSYNIYVLVNPSPAMLAVSGAGLNEDTFKDKEFNKGDFTPNNGFPMSSADQIQPVSVTPQNTKANPAMYVTNVQRMLAKVQLDGFTSGDKPVDFAQSAAAKFASKFEFKRYGIVNKRNSAYFFRRAGETSHAAVIGEKENGVSNYVIDPKFDLKIDPFAEQVARDNYWDREEMSATAAYWKAFDASQKDFIDYIYENTMTKTAQLQGYTTGLVLEAQFTPKVWKNGGAGYMEGNTFYAYNNEYYASLQEVQTACPGVKDFEDIDSEKYNAAETERITLTKKYAQQGVTVYYQAKCYYHFWIRHANNNKPNDMGVMEFGIVRNNVYRMSVNTIAGPGLPTPPFTPDRPDEDGETYLGITVNVLPWVVRNNNMDL